MCLKILLFSLALKQWISTFLSPNPSLSKTVFEGYPIYNDVFLVVKKNPQKYDASLMLYIYIFSVFSILIKIM